MYDPWHKGSVCRGPSFSSPGSPPPVPWELLFDTGASSQLHREAGEPCLLQGQAGSCLGCRAVGTCTRHRCQEQLRGACAGQCTNASIYPTFLWAGCVSIRKQNTKDHSLSQKDSRAEWEDNPHGWIFFFFTSETGCPNSPTFGEQSPA